MSKLINILFRKRKRATKERALDFNYELLDQNRDAVLMALYLGHVNR